jgi:glycosyltransferase involved in cell wall biosynthesis
MASPHPTAVILIPSFNSGATIKDTVASVAAQEELEAACTVYLADDASVDDTTAAALRAWTPECPLSVISRPTNYGQWRNVSTAIRDMPPDIEWVLVLHSDDIAKRGWVATMMSRIAACGPSVATICSSWDDLYADGSVRPGEDAPQRAIELIRGSPESVRGTLLKGCWWHISGCAIRVAAFREIGDFLPDMPQLGDWEWLLRCLARDWSVEYIPRTLIFYRNHATSVSSASFRIHRDLREGLRIIHRYRGYLGAKDILRLHAKRAYYLLRRIVASLTRFQFERAARAVPVIAATVVNLADCLVRNAHRPNPTNSLDRV